MLMYMVIIEMKMLINRDVNLVRVDIQMIGSGQ